MKQSSFEYNDVTSKRVQATLIDYTVVFTLTFAYIWIVGEPNKEGGRTVTGFPALLPIGFWFIWFIVAEAFWGAALGHAIVGLKVISEDGEEPSFSQIAKRRLCDVLEISWCFGLVAFLLVKNIKTKQHWGIWFQRH